LGELLALKRVGVTGGVASGKTTVCRIFEELGAYFVSADQIVHNLLIPGTRVGKEVEELLGSDCIVDGRFDRKKIAEKVFRTQELLSRYEQILHPMVRKEIEKEFRKASKLVPKPSFFVAEVPLLFEANFESMFDVIITVIADEKVCQIRFSENKADYKLRMSRHIPVEEKAQRSSYIITNQGSLDQLRRQVMIIFKQLS
jgi:dephospho-CoA kinase